MENRLNGKQIQIVFPYQCEIYINYIRCKLFQVYVWSYVLFIERAQKDYEWRKIKIITQNTYQILRKL